MSILTAGDRVLPLIPKVDIVESSIALGLRGRGVCSNASRWRFPDGTPTGSAWKAARGDWWMVFRGRRNQLRVFRLLDIDASAWNAAGRRRADNLRYGAKAALGHVGECPDQMTEHVVQGRHREGEGDHPGKPRRLRSVHPHTGIMRTPSPLFPTRPTGVPTPRGDRFCGRRRTNSRDAPTTTSASTTSSPKPNSPKARCISTSARSTRWRWPSSRTHRRGGRRRPRSDQQAAFGSGNPGRLRVPGHRTRHRRGHVEGGNESA